MDASKLCPQDTFSTKAPKPNCRANAPNTVRQEMAFRFREKAYAMPNNTPMPTMLINMRAS